MNLCFFFFHVGCWEPFAAEPNGELLQESIFSKRNRVCVCVCVSLPKEETEVSYSQCHVNSCQILMFAKKQS